MKILKFIIFAIGLFFASETQAQISVNLNIGTPPKWGPPVQSGVQYYYLPDVDAYYDIQSSRFIYYSGNTWVHRTTLPKHYRSYDLYKGNKIILTDYHGKTPYVYYKQHKVKYKKGDHGKSHKSLPYNSNQESHKSKNKAKGKGHGKK